ncbi:MAG: hypothetical protein ACR2JE_17725 [Acidobacteriaceae bacterium]
MSKPSEFQAEYLVVKQTAYGRKAGEAVGSLGYGRVVWLNGELQPDRQREPVAAYVEPHGLVYIDPQCLTPSRATVRHL